MKTIRRSNPLPGRILPIIVMISAAALLSACVNLLPIKTESPAVAEAPPPEPPPEVPPPKPKALYQWYGDGRTVSRIEIDVSAQKAVFYAGPHEVGWTRVASGVRSNPTPTGDFAVREKVVDKRSNLYGKIYNRKGRLVRSNAELGVHPIPPGGRFEGAKMPYFLRLTNDGIGMHAGPIPKPGRPASHGCIRLPHAFAPILFKHVGIGTPVSIVGNGPSYQAYLAQHSKKAAKRRARAPSAETAVAAAGSDAAPAAGSTPDAAAAPATDTPVAVATTQSAQPSGLPEGAPAELAGIPAVSEPTAAPPEPPATSDAAAIAAAETTPAAAANPPAAPTPAPATQSPATAPSAGSAPSERVVTPEPATAQSSGGAPSERAVTPGPAPAPAATPAAVAPPPAAPQAPRVETPAAGMAGSRGIEAGTVRSPTPAPAAPKEPVKES